VENKPTSEEKKKEEIVQSPQSKTRSMFKPETKKPVLVKGKNIAAHRETWIMICGVVIALVIITIIFMLLWNRFTVMFYWVIGALLIFFTRKTDLWYMGIEIHFPIAFFMSYVFGPLFAFSMIITSYAAVWKVRPDQGHGIMIQFTSLSIMIGLSLLLKYFYGSGITSSQFVWGFLIIVVLVQLVDGILSKLFCPSPPLKIVIIHSLDIIISYYVARFIGYKIITYLFTLV